jgi:hypothetical protein
MHLPAPLQELEIVDEWKEAGRHSPRGQADPQNVEGCVEPGGGPLDGLGRRPRSDANLANSLPDKVSRRACVLWLI